MLWLEYSHIQLGKGKISIKPQTHNRLMLTHRATSKKQGTHIEDTKSSLKPFKNIDYREIFKFDKQELLTLGTKKQAVVHEHF